MKDEDAEIPDYEKKRLQNIAEKKAMFEEKLMNAKMAASAKPFKCSKCFTYFTKKAQLQSHPCTKCDLCNKYFKNSLYFYAHDRFEHNGHFAIISQKKQPKREKKNAKVSYYSVSTKSRQFKCKLCHRGFVCEQGVISHAKRAHFLLKVTYEEIGYLETEM